MIKKMIVWFAFFALFIASIQSETLISHGQQEFQSEKLELVKSAVLMEQNSGLILFEKNGNEMYKPASVTKIMTLLLVFDGIAEKAFGYDDLVTVSKHAASMGGSQCFFEEGEQQTVRDMIKCIAVASGNDAACAMAEFVAGTEEIFVTKMNERAKSLGMLNTNFENACGLEAENHKISACDIALMARELMLKHPEIQEYSTIYMDSIVHKTRRGESEFDLTNTNKILKSYAGATGLKTGYTKEAGYCMAATATRNGVSLIAVVMGADTKETRNDLAKELLDYGFSRCISYQDLEGLPLDFTIPVEQGEKKTVTFFNNKEFQTTLVNGNAENVKREIQIDKKLEAPIKKGDVLGTVRYSCEDVYLGEWKIRAKEDVLRKTYSYTFSKLIYRFFMVK